MARIDTKLGRAGLEARRDPHWHKLSRGRHLGYRKSRNAGAWIARYRGDDGRREFHALGPFSDKFGFDEAVEKAHAWFREIDRGVRPEADTVAEVCRLYVKDRGKQKGEGTARDYERAFERSVYGGGGKDGKRHEAGTIGALPLAKLRARHVRDWRDELVAGGITKSTANRMLTRLRAALNFAVRERYVSADAAMEWRSVQPFAGASKRRDLYLDLEQRRALLKVCSGSLHNLLEAAMVTGARAGELVSARVSAFDSRSGSITLSGKTGKRTIPLSPAAAALFKKLAKGKLPAAYLLTRDNGRPWAHSDWDELVRDAAKAAKAPAGTCLYTLRHSWITAALTDGMSPLEVAKLVGTSLSMIDKNYGHLAQSEARASLARLAMV